MKILVDSAQKLYIVRSIDFNLNFYCNLQHIPEVLKTFNPGEQIEIFMLWNNRPKKLSKNQINDHLKSNQIDYIIGGKKYKCTFIGRQVTAIGKVYKIKTVIFAHSLKEVEKQLYAKFEHVTNLIVK
jgi:hypothetical protein